MTQMNPTLQSADTLAQAVRGTKERQSPDTIRALAAYEAAVAADAAREVIAELCPNAPAPQPEDKEDLRAFVHEVHFNHRYFPGPGSTWFIDFGQDCIRDYLSKHAPAQASRDSAITVNELTQWLWDKSKLTDITEEEEQRLDDLRETIEEHLAEMSVDAKEKTAKEIKS